MPRGSDRSKFEKGNFNPRFQGDTRTLEHGLWQECFHKDASIECPDCNARFDHLIQLGSNLTDTDVHFREFIIKNEKSIVIVFAEEYHLNSFVSRETLAILVIRLRILSDSIALPIRNLKVRPIRREHFNL
jgi:hypothetical protein